MAKYIEIARTNDVGLIWVDPWHEDPTPFAYWDDGVTNTTHLMSHILPSMTACGLSTFRLGTIHVTIPERLCGNCQRTNWGREHGVIGTYVWEGWR